MMNTDERWNTAENDTEPQPAAEPENNANADNTQRELMDRAIRARHLPNGTLERIDPEPYVAASGAYPNLSTGYHNVAIGYEAMRHHAQAQSATAQRIEEAQRQMRQRAMAYNDHNMQDLWRTVGSVGIDVLQDRLREVQHNLNGLTGTISTSTETDVDRSIRKKRGEVFRANKRSGSHGNTSFNFRGKATFISSWK